MAKQRAKMKLWLTEQPIEETWPCRPITREDIPALGRLMFDAYLGTIDYEGETLEDAIKEVQHTFASESERVLEDCSFLIEQDGRALACAIVTCWHDAPLLGYLMTHPSAKNQGLGAFLLKRSINALLAVGSHELYLFVTLGNLPAQHLYEKLGFRVVSTGFVAEVNGTRLGYEMAGAGRPVVLLHSGLADSRMWDAQFAALAPHCRVIRYDLRGFGRSEAPPGPFSNREDLAHLLRFLGIEKAVLIGSSMGGQLAVDFALEHPEMVDALIPVGAGISGKKPSDFLLERWKEIDAAAEGGDSAQAVELELRLWVDGPARTPEQVDPAVRELIRQTNSENVARQAEQEQMAPQSLDPPAINRLGEISAPTLVMVGAQDVPDTLAAAEKLASEIPGAGKIVLPGAAHLPSLEQPGVFNQIVLEFLSGL